MRRHRRAALASSLGALVLGTLAARCGDGGGPALRADCPAGQPQEIECVAPGDIVQGSTLPATWDSNNCQVRAEVKNSCCRPAQAGPIVSDGKCCYVFCGGACC